MMTVTDMIASLALFALYFLANCEAGEYCGYYGDYKYCENNCCNNECCDDNIRIISLVLGLVFGLGGTIVVIIIIICICRRRRMNGIVYRQQMPASSAVVITQNQQGVITSNMPAGVAHGGVQPPGPGVPPYGAYPQPMPQHMPQPYPYPQTQPAYAQAPPSYDSLSQKPQ